MSILEEVKQITAEQVSKKQDAAKLNYPKIIEKIKTAAAKGFSECIFSLSEINEYDKTLLQNDRFIVNLIDIPKDNYYLQSNAVGQQIFDKQWQVCW